MARRYLAQALLARGDRSGAKQIYSELVGRELMGRSAVRAQSWAHLELGVMAAQEGDLKVGGAGGGVGRWSPGRGIKLSGHTGATQAREPPTAVSTGRR